MLVGATTALAALIFSARDGVDLDLSGPDSQSRVTDSRDVATFIGAANFHNEGGGAWGLAELDGKTLEIGVFRFPEAARYQQIIDESIERGYRVQWQKNVIFRSMHAEVVADAAWRLSKHEDYDWPPDFRDPRSHELEPGSGETN